MSQTGWMGEGPDAAPAMPLAAQLLANKQRGPGDELAIALARSRAADAQQARDEADAARDPDEIAAAMVARGYTPGLMSDLAQRLQDAEAELAGEREKIERGERATERVRGLMERGQVAGLEAHRMLDDQDFGDPDRVRLLERRAGRLRGQLADAQAAISGPQYEAPADPLEAASRAAQRAGHDAFAEVTRAMRADIEAGRPVVRPFASASRSAAGAGTEHTGPDCWVCAQGRRRDAERAAAEGSAYRAYDPGQNLTPYYDAVRNEVPFAGVQGEIIRAVDAGITTW